MKRRRLLSAAIAATLVLGTYQSYAYDENFKGYEVHNISVKADAAKDEYGNTITEQSYYRTGGDVKVITREEIEKRHYRDVTEAIKRVPGVTFQNPGYRGGEYGYQFYNNGVSINGDSRVVVLVDGRRIDNMPLIQSRLSKALVLLTMDLMRQAVLFLSLHAVVKAISMALLI